MGIFKKKKVIDFTERYREAPEAKPEAVKQASMAAAGEQNSFNFLSNLASSSGSYPNSSDFPSYEPGSTSENEMGSSDDKRKKFAKRLMDMTEKIEDMSNQISHLQQRIELLEKKAKVGEHTYLS